MADDIAAVVARVREAVRSARSQSNPERRALVNLSYYEAKWLEGWLADFAAARQAEPPADLVETVALVLKPFLPRSEANAEAAVQAILAALAGRIVPPGMVAVPLDVLREWLWGDWRVSVFAAGKLRHITQQAVATVSAEEAGHGE